jgi:hypothetical protein
MQAEAPSPPRPALVSTPWLIEHKAIHDAINEEVFAPTLGCGKDLHELHESYGKSLKIFSHLLQAFAVLVEAASQPKVDSESLGRTIAAQVGPLVDPQVDIARIVQFGFRSARRNQNVVARLQHREVFADFLQTMAGRRWVAASHALSWGLFGLRYIVTEPDRFSKEDLCFCLAMIEHGPRDAFTFARAFELDLLDRERDEEPGEDFEVGELPEDLAALEAGKLKNEWAPQVEDAIRNALGMDD